MNLYAQAIRDAVTMREAAAAYGLHVDRQGWACCPFHRETKPSMRVYDSSKGWHCFGCGAGGSVIDFVMQMDGLTAAQAMRKLNEDFDLHLPLDTPPDWRARRRAALEAAKRKQAELRQALEEQKAIDEWRECSDRWLWLERMRLQNQPKKPLEPFEFEIPEEYAYALQELPAAKYEAMEAHQRMADVLEHGRKGNNHGKEDVKAWSSRARPTAMWST